jgi:hypothetical protein
MGIRYLTSSSSQVVADIQVIHSKLKLNGALLTAGVVELTLAIAFLSGWTFLGKAVVWGFEVGPPASLGYWAISGLAFFICSGYILSGSKNSIWAVPVIHVCFIMEFFKSYSIWESIFKHEMVYTPWVATAVVSLAKSQPFYFLGAFDLWAVFLIGTLFSFRRHLVN